MNAPVQCVRKKGKTISVSDDFISAVKKICNLRKAELLPDDSFFELFIGSDILDSMETSDSQIIWGRRGTGKTHLLKAFTQKVNFDPNNKSIAYYISCDNISFDSPIDIDSLSDDEKMKRYARNTFICFLSNLIEQMIDNYEVLLNCKEFYKAFDNDQKKALRDDVDTQLCDLLENCDYGIPTVVSKEQTIVETDTTEHKRETNIETGIDGELSTKPSFFASLMARFGHKRNKAKQQKSSEEVKTTKRYSFSFSETKRILERLLWLAMDSELCIQYMSLMAKYLADLAVNPTVVGTDKTKYLHHAYKKTFRSKKSLALYICFQDVLPQPAPDASLKKIIKFKDKRQTELSEFQYQLLQFENKLSHSTSIDEAKDQIELFKKQLEKSILEIEKIYKDEKINYTFGTINAFVDALGIAGSISSIASLVAMAASLPTWAIISTIGTGAALGIGYSFLQHKMTANHERLTNDFAYLYDLYQNKIIL